MRGRCLYVWRTSRIAFDHKELCYHWHNIWKKMRTHRVRTMNGQWNHHWSGQPVTPPSSACLEKYKSFSISILSLQNLRCKTLLLSSSQRSSLINASNHTLRIFSSIQIVSVCATYFACVRHAFRPNRGLLGISKRETYHDLAKSPGTEHIFNLVLFLLPERCRLGEHFVGDG